MPDEKNDVLAKLKRASTSSTTAGARRDALIIEAARTYSYSTVAAAAGLSKPRVAQIVAASRENPLDKDVE